MEFENRKAFMTLFNKAIGTGSFDEFNKQIIIKRRVPLNLENQQKTLKKLLILYLNNSLNKELKLELIKLLKKHTSLDSLLIEEYLFEK